MKNRNKVIIALIVAIITFTLLAASAIAASAYVALSTSETSDRSVAVGLSHYGHSTGYNYVSSARDVYLKLQYSSGGGWSTIHTEIMDQGEAESTPSYGSSSSTWLWRTELNPYGWLTSGCSAYGYVYDY